MSIWHSLQPKDPNERFVFNMTVVIVICMVLLGIYLSGKAHEISSNDLFNNNVKGQPPKADPIPGPERPKKKEDVKKPRQQSRFFI